MTESTHYRPYHGQTEHAEDGTNDAYFRKLLNNYEVLPDVYWTAVCHAINTKYAPMRYYSYDLDLMKLFFDNGYKMYPGDFEMMVDEDDYITMADDDMVIYNITASVVDLYFDQIDRQVQLGMTSQKDANALRDGLACSIYFCSDEIAAMMALSKRYDVTRVMDVCCDWVIFDGDAAEKEDHRTYVLREYIDATERFTRQAQSRMMVGLFLDMVRCGGWPSEAMRGDDWLATLRPQAYISQRHAIIAEMFRNTYPDDVVMVAERRMRIPVDRRAYVDVYIVTVEDDEDNSPKMAG